MKKIGIGYENYKEFIDSGLYYVDKTLFIRDLLEKGGKVTLFTRPRRFGKTLALSMLQTFFEQEPDADGNTAGNTRYFEGMKIMEASPAILERMGKFPVIKLSLKSAKQPGFRMAFLKLREEIAWEFDRHSYLLDSDKLTADEKDSFAFLRQTRDADTPGDDAEFDNEVGRYSTSLKFLSKLLKKHHGADTVILIDEYDVPLESAFYSGFYDEMTGFIRSLFESALKTNDALELAVVTGCLRISKESIFTGMNNLEINSIRRGSFGEFFGFTTEETVRMLQDYGMGDRIGEAREWYDGYLFGDKEVYNPWSISKYVYSIIYDRMQFPEAYWANTSSNAIVKDLVERADDKVRDELDLLISGGTIEKKIHEDITYSDIYDSEENLWNFLFFTGYMRKESERSDGDDIYITMRIPNREIRSIYHNQISKWFEGVVEKSDRNVLHGAVLSGDADSIENYVSDLLEKCISTFDSAESFYHGFFLSLLYGVPRYSVRSNREAGDGRPDIVLYPNRPKDPVIIFEAKVRKTFSEMQSGLEEALSQIRDKRYEAGILAEGYAGVMSYGICFCRKSCIVQRMETPASG